MTEEATYRPIAPNPKPDTAEGVGEIIRQSLAVLDGNMKVTPLTLDLPGGGEAPAYFDADGIHVLPANALDDYLDAPRHRSGTATLLDLRSFIDHAKRFMDSDSVVFADTDRAAPSLTTVLDYHPAGADSAPRWGRHRDKFNFPLSDEWQDWMKQDGVPMDMPVFAKFIEDHITDVLSSGEIIIEPNTPLDKFVRLLGGPGKLAEPARLVEISKGFRVHEATTTAQAFVSQTGEASVQFENKHDTNQQGGTTTMALPSMFAIGIPVFRDGAAYQLLAQFRYRTGSGKVVFFYDLWRADLVFDHAIEEAIAEVREQTGLPVLRGKPE